MLNNTLSINKLLGHETGGSEHGKAAILEFLGLHDLELSSISWLETKRIETKISRNVAVTEKTGLVEWDILRFNPSNFSTLDLSLGNTGTKEQPEDGVDLGKVGDGGSSNFTIEDEGLGFDGFTNEETDSGKHGNTSVGQFGLTVPLQGHLISLGSEVEGIEEANRLESSWDRVNGEGVDGSGGLSGLHGSEGGGGTGEEGRDEELHFSLFVFDVLLLDVELKL